MNKMGMSKVGAISKAQKRKVFKPVKGASFGFFENPVCCKISNKLKGDPLETKKIRIFKLIFEKKRKMRILMSLSAKIHKTWTPFGLFGTLVCCKKSKKNEIGIL